MKQDKDILVLRAWLERLVELKEKIDKIESILVRLDEINITKKGNINFLLGYIESARELLNK